MFTKHSKNGISVKRDSGLTFTSESLINPLIKPKTLAELKAEMDHTGINPSPVKLRSGIDESIEGVDPMETPPVVIGGDIFENARNSRRLANEYDVRVESLKDSLKNTQESADTTS